ncbi:MAG: hypothetical protein ACKPHU_28070, partial [Planctomycetaceae bacterium]
MAGSPQQALAVLDSASPRTESSELQRLIAWRRAECLRELKSEAAAESAFARLAASRPDSALSEAALLEQMTLQQKDSDATSRFLLQTEHLRAAEWRQWYSSHIVG